MNEEGLAVIELPHVLELNMYTYTLTLTNILFQTNQRKRTPLVGTVKILTVRFTQDSVIFSYALTTFIEEATPCISGYDE